MRKLTLSLAALMASAPVALAQTLPMTPQEAVIGNSMVYFSLGGTFARTSLPRYSGSLTTGNGVPLFSTSLNFFQGGPAGTVGFVLPEFGLGSRPRIEFAGTYLIAFSNSETGSFSTLGVAATWTRLDGTTNGMTPATWTADLRTRHEAFDGAFRFKTDFAFAPNLTVTPRIGFVAGTSHTSFNLIYVQNVGANTLFNPVNEELRSRRYGGEIGFDATLLTGTPFKLHAGVVAAIFAQRTRLRGDDCIDNSFAAPGCNTIIPTSSVNVTRTNMAGRLGFSGGASYVLPNVLQLTLMGSARWDLRTPGIRNPTVADLAPASIRFSNQWSFSGFAMATFPIQMP